MPRIRVYGLEEAEGLLKAEYDKAVKRAGKVWHIVAIMSQNPLVQQKSMALYGVLMNGRSPLSRGQREMLAVVVSRSNGCLY